MNKLNKILSKSEIDVLVKEGKAEYKGWKDKRYELAYIGESIYWNHTIQYGMRFYYHIGKRDREMEVKTNEK